MINTATPCVPPADAAKHRFVVSNGLPLYPGPMHSAAFVQRGRPSADGFFLTSIKKSARTGPKRFLSRAGSETAWQLIPG